MGGIREWAGFRGVTHVALEVGEVKVGDEQDRLGLKVGQRLEDGHIVPLLEEGDFYIGNCKKTRKDKRKSSIWTLKKHILSFCFKTSLFSLVLVLFCIFLFCILLNLFMVLMLMYCFYCFIFIK